MEREYFCCGCGLFHWVQQYRTNEDTGLSEYVRYEGCPNEECVSHLEENVAYFAVDTFGWAYFCENHLDFVNEIKWSSPKYAPQHAIEFYQAHGVPIR